MSQSQASQVFGVHRTTLGRWHKRAQSGSLENRPACGGPLKIPAQDEAALLLLLQATPDATLEEHVARWHQERGRQVSASTLRRVIVRLNWTRKKRA